MMMTNCCVGRWGLGAMIGSLLWYVLFFCDEREVGNENLSIVRCRSRRWRKLNWGWGEMDEKIPRKAGEGENSLGGLIIVWLTRVSRETHAGTIRSALWSISFRYSKWGPWLHLLSCEPLLWQIRFSFPSGLILPPRLYLASRTTNTAGRIIEYRELNTNTISGANRNSQSGLVTRDRRSTGLQMILTGLPAKVRILYPSVEIKPC